MEEFVLSLNSDLCVYTGFEMTVPLGVKVAWKREKIWGRVMWTRGNDEYFPVIYDGCSEYAFSKYSLLMIVNPLVGVYIC